MGGDAKYGTSVRYTTLWCADVQDHDGRYDSDGTLYYLLKNGTTDENILKVRGENYTTFICMK